jgi:hypothetical protein
MVYLDIPLATLLQLYCIGEVREAEGVWYKRTGTCNVSRPEPDLVQEQSG